MLTKITSWVLYIFIAISVVLAVLFYFGGMDEVTEEPFFTTSFLNWGYALFFAALLVTVVLQIVNFIKKLAHDGASALKSLGGIIGIVAVVLIAFAMSDNSILTIPGYDGDYNTPFWSVFTDTVLYSMYGLAAIAALSIVVTSIIKVFR